PLISCLILLPSHATPRDLHSFPTRRSSDLGPKTRLSRFVRVQVEVSSCPFQPLARAAEIKTLAYDTVIHERTKLGINARKAPVRDRKSTRLNSSHVKISYAVFCLKKKKIRT